jgi:hypothetical protein
MHVQHTRMSNMRIRVCAYMFDIRVCPCKGYHLHVRRTCSRLCGDVTAEPKENILATSQELGVEIGPENF